MKKLFVYSAMLMNSKGWHVQSVGWNVREDEDAYRGEVVKHLLEEQHVGSHLLTIDVVEVDMKEVLTEMGYDLDKLDEDDQTVEPRFFSFTTCMGKYNERLPFIYSLEEEQEFNHIGYAGKTKDGTLTTREEWLNSLGRGKFRVTQTKFDSGDFQEGWSVTWWNKK